MFEAGEQPRYRVCNNAFCPSPTFVHRMTVVEIAGVAKQVDAPSLKLGAEKRVGSKPATRTKGT